VVGGGADSLVVFLQADDGIRDRNVTGVQTCALPIFGAAATSSPPSTEQIDSAYGRALAGLTAPMPGAQELVAAMSGTIPVAVAKIGRASWRERAWKRMGRGDAAEGGLEQRGEH